MANELRIQDTQKLSKYFVSALDSTANLPESVDKQRLALNFISLLQDHPELKEYGAEVLAPIVVRSAKDNLDVLNQEVYIYKGYGGKLTYTPSYKGLRKMAIERSVKPVKQIIAKVIYEGDELSEEFVNGEAHLHYKSTFGAKRNPIGCFAICTFKDGTEIYETMTKEETDAVKAKSRNSGAWKDFETEMMKKAVTRRLCKQLTLDFNDNEQAETFSGADEMIDDPKEQAAKDISENANQQELDEDVIEVEVTDDGGTVVVGEQQSMNLGE